MTRRAKTTALGVAITVLFLGGMVLGIWNFGISHDEDGNTRNEKPEHCEEEMAGQCGATGTALEIYAAVSAAVIAALAWIFMRGDKYSYPEVGKEPKFKYSYLEVGKEGWSTDDRYCQLKCQDEWTWTFGKYVQSNGKWKFAMSCKVKKNKGDGAEPANGQEYQRSDVLEGETSVVFKFQKVNAFP